MNAKPLTKYWNALEAGFRPVVPFDPEQDSLCHLDLSASNDELSEAVYSDLDKFNVYIENVRRRCGARYLIGGYAELRKIYGMSNLFDASVSEEPRRLHLGVDIWGPAGTPVYAPTEGRLHSCAWNGARGDYGGTLILVHETGGMTWHTLYGHLSKATMTGKCKGDAFAAGAALGALGEPAENGWWPPHLHVQVILDMQGMEGDYPGVCRYSERAAYLRNCPDPEGLLRWGKKR
jgi:murein DD-endopeptidase MepM/ murein hydrolase activator NlpD